MTNKEVINFLNQVRKILLDDKSWLESTIQPINEAFDMAINALTAQPETHDKRTETHARDCISRQMAIDMVEESRRLNHHQDGKAALAHEHEHRHFLKILMELPFAQPEIIQCKDCKHSIDFYGDGECYCRRPNRELDWIGDWNFYCGCAERKEE